MAICAFILLSRACSCTRAPSIEEQRYAGLIKEVNDSDLPEDLKTEISSMSFEEFLQKNPLKREICKFHDKAFAEQQLGDSIWNDLALLKTQELQLLREKYQNKTEILRIKRIWLNGDILPWSYDSWLKVSYAVNSRSSTITPNMLGHAKYTGETKLDYINVVFSDNSYKRFLIKDNPEWLLARKGEKVERRYTVSNYQTGTDVGRVLEKNAFDLAINITYVPLFK